VETIRTHDVFIDLSNTDHEDLTYTNDCWKWEKDGENFQDLVTLVRDIEFWFCCKLTSADENNKRFTTHEIRSLHNALCMFSYKFCVEGANAGPPDFSGGVVEIPRLYGNVQNWKTTKADPNYLASSMTGGRPTECIKLECSPSDGFIKGTNMSTAGSVVTIYAKNKLKATNNEIMMPAVFCHEFCHIYASGYPGQNKELLEGFAKHFAYWRYKQQKHIIAGDEAKREECFNATCKPKIGLSDNAKTRQTKAIALKTKCKDDANYDPANWTQMSKTVYNADHVIWEPPLTNYARCSVQEHIAEVVRFYCYGVEASVRYNKKLVANYIMNFSFDTKETSDHIEDWYALSKHMLVAQHYIVPKFKALMVAAWLPIGESPTTI